MKFQEETLPGVITYSLSMAFTWHLFILQVDEVLGHGLDRIGAEAKVPFFFFY